MWDSFTSETKPRPEGQAHAQEGWAGREGAALSHTAGLDEKTQACSLGFRTSEVLGEECHKLGNSFVLPKITEDPPGEQNCPGPGCQPGELLRLLLGLRGVLAPHEGAK